MLVGFFCILMGVMISLVAFDMGSMGSATKNAPNWIIGLGGAIFIGGGAMLLKPGPVIGQITAGVTVISFTTIFAWIALFGRAEHFSSSWSIFSPATQVVFARILFGLVALLGLAISINAIRTHLKKDS